MKAEVDLSAEDRDVRKDDRKLEMPGVSVSQQETQQVGIPSRRTESAACRSGAEEG